MRNKKQVDISGTDTLCPNCGCKIQVSVPEILDAYEECVKALIHAEKVIKMREKQLEELGFKFNDK